MGRRLVVPMGRRRVVPMGQTRRRAGPMVRRRAGMWGGGMQGFGVGRDEGGRRAGTWGVGPSCWADGAEVSRADGAEACQD
jgi:hypothetical protein